MNRREYAASLVCGLTAMGGCQSQRSEEARTPESSRPDSATTETENCRGDRTQYSRNWTVLEAYEKFELGAEPTTVAHGEPITFRLRNRTLEEQMTGNDRKYSLQRKTADGWEELLYHSDVRGITDEGILHQPGEGFTWEFTASKEGFSEYPYRVCTEITAGQYCFLYWGIVPDDESSGEGESTLAAEFTVED